MWAEPEFPPEGEQPFFVRAYEMGHRLVVDPMSMKPNAAVEGEAHPLAAACEFVAERAYEQEMLPSSVAVPMGTAVPEKT